MVPSAQMVPSARMAKSPHGPNRPDGPLARMAPSSGWPSRPDGKKAVSHAATVLLPQSLSPQAPILSRKSPLPFCSAPSTSPW